MKVDILNTVKYLIFFLFFFYFAQGVFFPSGLFLPKVALAILLIFEVIFFILLVNHWKLPVINGFVLMVILNVAYYLFSDKTIIVSAIINVEDGLIRLDTWKIVKSIFFNLSFFFPVYYLTIKNRISEKQLVNIFFIFFLFAVVGYFSSSEQISIETNKEEFTNNAGFVFVHIMPFLFLIRKRSLAIILIFISLGFVMMAAKRGAILIAVLFTLYYFYQEYIKNSGRNFVKNVFVLIILILISASLIYYFYLSSDYLQLRLEKTLEGDSSGRDEIYSNIWNYFISPYNSIWNYLFGFGFAATIKMGGMFAHNDWLELLAMSGMLGVFIYLFFFSQIYRFSKKDFLSHRDRKIINSVLLIWFLKTIFSMGYTDIGLIPIIMILSYLVGKYYKQIYL